MMPVISEEIAFSGINGDFSLADSLFLRTENTVLVDK